MNAPQTFQDKYRALMAHKAAVPLAVQQAQNAVADWDGSQMADGAAPRDGLTCGHVRTLLAEIDRLTRLEKQLRDDLRDSEREGREAARDAAAEAHWQAKEETRGGHY